MRSWTVWIGLFLFILVGLTSACMIEPPRTTENDTNLPIFYGKDGTGTSMKALSTWVKEKTKKSMEDRMRRDRASCYSCGTSMKPGQRGATGRDLQIRRDSMVSMVMPEMKQMFVEYSPSLKHKNKFHCQSCHGEANQDDKNFDFSKPSHLYPLDPNNMPTENDPNPRTAAAVRFMKYMVMPAMEVLLNKKDLTCFDCHAKTKK